jgi:hypothetical protein
MLEKAPKRDYSNKYYLKSGETQFTVQMEKTGVNIGVVVHGQWRQMEGVQKYSCTEVRIYRCTDVQMYRSTGKCCLERMVAVGLTKRDPDMYK